MLREEPAITKSRCGTRPSDIPALSSSPRPVFRLCSGFASGVLIAIDLGATHAVSHLVPGTSSAETTRAYVWQLSCVSLTPAICSALGVESQCRHGRLPFGKMARPTSLWGGLSLD